jgi:hypothetical protein
MRQSNWIGWGVGAAGLIAAGASWATRSHADGIPGASALSYSGTLESVSGEPISGSKEVQLGVYNAVSGGQQLCNVKQTVALTNGRFQVVLPDACTNATRMSPDLWIDVAVDGESLGRSKLAAVPYAVEAARASAASSATGALASQVVPKGAVMAFNLAACPAGWSAFADAQGRVIVGSSATLARGTPVGSDALVLGPDQMPSHTHGVNDPGHSHSVQNVINYNIPPTFAGGPQGIGQGGIETSVSGTNISIQSAGGSQPFDNRQASLALLYCIKD